MRILQEGSIEITAIPNKDPRPPFIKENRSYLSIKVIFPHSLPLHLLSLLLPSFVLASFVCSRDKLEK